jgi:hypothetical protein
VIIETPGKDARVPIGWTVGETPELQLGSATSEGPDQFFQIGMTGAPGLGGIAGLPGGRILVLNGSSAELRFFDREGHFLYKVSGVGDGPGEFRRPLLVPYASSDSLLLFDRTRRQFTLFSSDGQAHRSFPLERLSPQFVTGSVQGASDAGVVMTTILGMPMGDGQQSQSMGIRWIRLDPLHAEIVAQFRTLVFCTNDLDGRGTRYFLSVPFSIGPAAAVGRNAFFVTGGDAPEVRRFDTHGRLMRIFRLAETPRPVTPEDVETTIDFIATPFDSMPTRFDASSSRARRAYEQMDFPDYWPSFQSIRMDRLGWVWVELFRPPQDSIPRWMVFDSSGVARGTLEFPPDLEVQDIGTDYILGRWLDNLGVEYVRRYRLDRLP